MSELRLALHFTRREIRNRYLGSFSGGAWAFLQPLIQLAVYSFVFVYIFRAPVPADSPVGYVPFLLLGLWPWNALAEALARACTSIQENAALIGKVAMPSEVFVFANVAATFLVQTAGFLVMCIVMRAYGIPLNLLMLPAVLGVFVQLFVFALGLGFVLASLQVFVRDLSAAMPQLLMIWMFASPILYAPETVPEQFRAWLDWNPVAHYTAAFRTLLLNSGTVTIMGWLGSLVVALLVLALGTTMFRRCKPHFEDFL